MVSVMKLYTDVFGVNIHTRRSLEREKKLREYNDVIRHKRPKYNFMYCNSRRKSLVYNEIIGIGMMREKFAECLQDASVNMYVAHDSSDRFAISDNATGHRGIEDFGSSGILVE